MCTKRKSCPNMFLSTSAYCYDSRCCPVAAPFLFSKINAWRPVKRILVHKREKEIGDNVMRLIRGIRISAS